jgi:exoribonuclease-2
MSRNFRPHRNVLTEIAWQAMTERDLLPDFTDKVKGQVDQMEPVDPGNVPEARDLRHLLWCSIDNDDSRDLDQLTVAEMADGGSGDPHDGAPIRIWVAVADVDSLVRKDSPVDRHAKHNTTSVYTAARIFPMLPERLSTDLTSLNPDEDRLAVVVEMVVAGDGEILESDIYRAVVHNHAKLAYNAVDAWIEGHGPMPERMAAVDGLADLVHLQDAAAQRLRQRRFEGGALDLETPEARPVFEDGTLTDLEEDLRNRGKELIENFMVAANGVTARYLDHHGFASLRRVVRTPKRWPRIVELAREFGERLPEEPDSKALEKFLEARHEADPDTFPDLSLSVVKLLGRGEYAIDLPGQDPPGHFGLAVKDYTHSTAPSRRYPDLITQRLLKAALEHEHTPYTNDELAALALHCTRKEDDAEKVERRVRKSAAALLLEKRIGQTFDGIVTGASPKGTWVRIFRPPVEGRVIHGERGLDVGDRVKVRLVDTNVEMGFIDFERASHHD